MIFAFAKLFIRVWLVEHHKPSRSISVYSETLQIIVHILCGFWHILNKKEDKDEWLDFFCLDFFGACDIARHASHQTLFYRAFLNRVARVSRFFCRQFCGRIFRCAFGAQLGAFGYFRSWRCAGCDTFVAGEYHVLIRR